MSSAAHITLCEYSADTFFGHEFVEEHAVMLNSHYRNQVSVEWPTPKTQGKWQITAFGWIGYIKLNPECGILLQPKVPIGNIFRMLEFAYDLQSFRLLDGLYNADSVNDVFERLAVILAKRVLKRARQGLYRTYAEEYELQNVIRGRIDVTALSRSPEKTRIACFTEDHTLDNEDNQILALTLNIISRIGVVLRKEHTLLVRSAERALRHSISLRHVTSQDCMNRSYNRLNADYETMHKLCRFFLDTAGPAHNSGSHAMIPFLVDMARLFELFVAEWLKAHIDSDYTITIQESRSIGKRDSLHIQMDILIADHQGAPICVVDTKYKAGDTVSSADYYQMIAYADAVGCRNALLVYPRVLPEPFDVQPGSIRVRSAYFDISGELDNAGELLLQQLGTVLGDSSKND